MLFCQSYVQTYANMTSFWSRWPVFNSHCVSHPMMSVVQLELEPSATAAAQGLKLYFHLEILTWLWGRTNLGLYKWSAWGHPTAHPDRSGSYSLRWERSPHHRRTRSQCHVRTFDRGRGGRCSPHSQVWWGVDMLVREKEILHMKTRPKVKNCYLLCWFLT